MSTKRISITALAAMTLMLVVLATRAIPSVQAMRWMDDGAARTPEASTPAGETEIFGTVDSVDGSTWVIDGQQVTVNPQTEVKGTLEAGDLVKAHVTEDASGSLVAREIEAAVAGQNDDMNDDNGTDSSLDDVNDDNGTDSSLHDVNDDNGTDSSLDDVNDDNGTDSSLHDVNDDNGTDSSLHDANDDNSTDSGSDSSMDDASDDHSGSDSSGTSHDSGDDHGGDDHESSDSSGSGSDD